MRCCSSMKAKSSLPISSFTCPHLLCCQAQRCRHLRTMYRSSPDHYANTRATCRCVVKLAVAFTSSAQVPRRYQWITLQHGLAHLLIEGAHRELHQHVIVNDIGRMTGLGCCRRSPPPSSNGVILRETMDCSAGNMAGHQRGIHRMLTAPRRGRQRPSLQYATAYPRRPSSPRRAGRSCPTADPAYCPRPRMASQGNWSKRPSSTITRPPYSSSSSAGWKISCSVPVNWRVRARYSAA